MGSGQEQTRIRRDLRFAISVSLSSCRLCATNHKMTEFCRKKCGMSRMGANGTEDARSRTCFGKIAWNASVLHNHLMSAPIRI